MLPLNKSSAKAKPTYPIDSECLSKIYNNTQSLKSCATYMMFKNANTWQT